MNDEEKQAKNLIKKHLGTRRVGRDAPSYQELIQDGWDGFMHYYLEHSINEETMTSFANYAVTKKLSRIDEQRGNKKTSLVNFELLKINKRSCKMET